MDDDRESCLMCHLKLEAEDFFLLLQEFPGPVAVDADLSDGPYPVLRKSLFHGIHFVFPICSDRCRMKSEGGEESARMAFRQSEHCFSGSGVDVRKDHPGDARFNGAGYREVLLCCEGLVIEMGMSVDELHQAKRIFRKSTYYFGN